MDSILISAAPELLASVLPFFVNGGKMLVGLGLVIFVHELGHFLVAKACGVKCEKFYVGFDVPIKIGKLELPRTLGKFQWGETEYGIGIIPLGGYVKMLGQDDNPANAQQEADRIRVANGESGEGAEELDPRSYPAKSVPQRMAIISAGVIMNLIFAVIFAAIAYKVGVKITPCEIAGTSPGDPAWQLGIEPDSKIIQIGKEGEPDEHLRFFWELSNKVVHAGIAAGDEDPPEMDILVRRDGKEEWRKIRPTNRLKEKMDRVTLGVIAPHSNVVAAVSDHRAAGKAKPAFQKHDRIVALNSIELDKSQANEAGDIPSFELNRLLAQQTTAAVTFTVERKPEGAAADAPPERVQIEVPPNPWKTVGLEMVIGPIVALQLGSPAIDAGFAKGDIIKSVDGQPVGDPMTLPYRNLTRSNDSPVEFVVQRDGKDLTLTVNLRGPPMGMSRGTGHGARVALDRVGVSYEVTSEVAAVAAGSPAEEAGLAPGDVVTKCMFVAEGDELKEKVSSRFSDETLEEFDVDQQVNNWPYICESTQSLIPGMKLKLTWERDGKSKTGTLEPVDSGFFTVERGLLLTGFTRVHTAENWSDAFSLGARETKEKLLEVVNVLKLLVTGRVSPKKLGGPIMIAAVAGSEASEGIPRLLIFLTFLSANLAILNFLPIPALDGGHMVFLLAEAVMRRPVDERLQMTLTMIGVACLLGLMLFVVVNDLTKFFL